MPDLPPTTVTVRLAVASVEHDVELAVLNGVTDPVRGEVLRPFEVLPALTATFEARGVLVPRGGEVAVPMTLAAPTLASDEPVSVNAQLVAPPGFTVRANALPISLTKDVPEQAIVLRVTATRDAEAGAISVVSDHPGYQRHRIAYPHVPERTVLSPATLPVIPVDLDRGRVERVAYLEGSGDGVPDVLRAVGYAVTLVEEEQLGELADFDALVLGVRAYNTRPTLASHHDELMDYVAGGGTVVVQYNTSRRWSTLSAPIGPAPLDVGKGRVTDETATVTFLDPAHPVLARPNRLAAADFDGWVQERGLYFVESWDDAYTPLFEMADPGEEPQRGSVIVARHGRGTFIYTGLSFFRQLPAGVPGAMRLFANLLAGAR